MKPIRREGVRFRARRLSLVLQREPARRLIKSKKKTKTKSVCGQRVVFSRLTSRSVARCLLPDDWSVYFAIYVCRDWPNFITDCSQERLLSLVNYRQKVADNDISGLFLVLLFLGVWLSLLRCQRQVSFSYKLTSLIFCLGDWIFWYKINFSFFSNILYPRHCYNPRRSFVWQYLTSVPPLKVATALLLHPTQAGIAHINGSKRKLN